MNDNSLYELTVDNKQLIILNKALSDYICWQHEGIDLDIVNVPTTIENIKVAQDMKAVINYQLGKALHTPKQTSDTSLMWCKEVDLDIQEEQFNHNSQEFKQHNDEYLQKTDEQIQKELSDSVEYAKYCLDTFLKNQPKGGGNTLTKAWNNVKERHWDAIKRTGEK